MEESNSNNNIPQLSNPSPEESLNLSGATLREKLEFMRARSRANAKPLRSSNSASATPSSAGDIEPTLPSPMPQGPSTLSVRVDREPHPHTTMTEPLVEHQNDAPAAFVAPQELHIDIPTEEPAEPDEQTVIGLDETTHRVVVQLGPSEFAIPMPMDARVRDDYETTVSNESTNIRKFLLEGNEDGMEIDDNSTISNLAQMITRLNNITTHPDLNFPDRSGSGEDIDNTTLASWAEYSSSKFQLLGYLIDAATNEDFHIIIFVKEGRPVRIVENYLLGKGFVYLQSRSEVAADAELPLSRGLLSFAIRPTSENIRKPSQKPSLIFALDSSFDASNPSVRDLRTTWARGESITPVIRPIVSNSVEHVELCLPNSPNPKDSQFRRLVRHTIAFRSSVGELQDDALGVQETSEAIFHCLSSDSFQQRLPLLEALDVDDFEEETADVERESSIPEPEQLRSTAPSRQKRWRDGEEQDDNNPAKKQRTTPPLEENLKTAERKLSQMQKEHSSEINTLQSTLTEVQTIYRQTQSALSTLQHRYESRTEELHKTRRERDQAVEASTKFDQRLQRQRDEISKLKEERTALNTDLKDARESLKSGGVTATAADLESAREEIRTLQSSNASLEKTAQYEKSQSEYTRQQYQNASTAAAQSGMEVRQLREENEQLKHKVASEAYKLKELKIKNDGEKHLAYIEELKLTLASREKLLRKREEDLRDAMKNRPFRRASSTTPRSFSRPNSPGSMNGGNRGSALRSISEAAP